MFENRYEMGVCVISKWIYVVGGYRVYSSERFDVIRGVWERMGVECGLD